MSHDTARAGGLTPRDLFNYHLPTAQYLTNISETFRYFYLANPKVASTTLLKILQSAEVNGDEGRLPPSPHDRDLSPLKSFHDISVSPETVFLSGEYFRFTLVRNPYSRALATYLDKMVQNAWERNRLLPELGFAPDTQPSFLAFLEAVDRQPDLLRDIHWSTQSRLLQRDRINYDFIGRFEHFRFTLPALLKRIGIEGHDKGATSTAAHATHAATKLSEYVGPRERDLILKVYSPDFVNFGYGADPAMAHV